MKNLRKLSREELINRINEFASTLTGEDKEKVEEALALAISLHKKAKGPDIGPNIEQTLRVAVRCISFGMKDGEEVITALLHNSVDDYAKKIITHYGYGQLPAEARMMSGDPRIVKSLAIGLLTQKFGYGVSLRVAQLCLPDLSNLKPNDHSAKEALLKNQLKELIYLSKPAGLIRLAEFIEAVDLLEKVGPAERKIVCEECRPFFEIYMNAIASKKIRIKPKLIPEILDELENGLELSKAQLK
jgi:hypothetical protein